MWRDFLGQSFVNPPLSLFSMGMLHTVQYYTLSLYSLPQYGSLFSRFRYLKQAESKKRNPDQPEHPSIRTKAKDHIENTSGPGQSLPPSGTGTVLYPHRCRELMSSLQYCTVHRCTGIVQYCTVLLYYCRSTVLYCTVYTDSTVPYYYYLQYL